MSRLEWDEVWLGMTCIVGKRSACTRAQYGAVITSEDNRVLAVGYNGPPAGSHQKGFCVNWCQRSIDAAEGRPVDPDYLDCHAIHAEANALLRSSSLWTEQSPKLYVNGTTCLRCALLVANSGIRTVHMMVTEYELKRNPDATAALLEKYGIEAVLHHA